MQSKEQKKEYLKEWKKVNPEKISEINSRCRSNYTEERKQELNNYARERYKKMSQEDKFEYQQKKLRAWKERSCGSVKGWLRKTLQNARSTSRIKNYEFNLDLDFLMEIFQSQLGKCKLTGLNMNWEFDSACAISIDRIDSNKGYVKNNVQLTTKFSNYAKNVFSNEVIKNLIKQMKEEK